MNQKNYQLSVPPSEEHSRRNQKITMKSFETISTLDRPFMSRKGIRFALFVVYSYCSLSDLSPSNFSFSWGAELPSSNCPFNTAKKKILPYYMEGPALEVMTFNE